MGKLLITAVPSQQTAKAAASRQAAPSQATSEGPPPEVTAVIRFGKNEYRFNIFGVSLNDIFINITGLIPRLEVLVSDQRRRPYLPMHRCVLGTYPTDSQYKIPRQLTFSARGYSDISVAIAGSGEALYNLLNEAIKFQKNDITTLISNNKDKRYLKGILFNSGLEKLPFLVPKIQLVHVSKLITIQLLVALNAEPVLKMVANLLTRQCLPHLKKLELLYSRECKATRKNTSYILQRNYPEMLHTLYHTLKTQSQLPALEHLRLLLWCEQMNESGLQVLQRLYPTLKTLAIDSITPRAKLVIKEEHSDHTTSYDMNVVGGVAHVTRTSHYVDTWQELTFPVDTITSDKSTLIDFLRQQAAYSQLECLEIYDWPVAAEEPNFDLQTLQTAIAQGCLPKLNNLVIRANADEFFVQTPSTSRNTWLDTKDLLAAVIEQNLSLHNLQLLMPEQNAYIAWLEYIAAGRFPALKTLHYRLPDPFIEPGTLHKESEETHYPRVINSLTLIFNAIVERRVPKLESVIFEGDLPEPFTHLVQNIDGALQQMQSQPAALAACYI